jgi:hypothetical protein
MYLESGAYFFNPEAAVLHRGESTTTSLKLDLSSSACIKKFLSFK